MKTIPLTRGRVALVDDEAYEEELARFKWHGSWSRDADTYYATRKTPPRDGPQKHVAMHRVIMRAGPGQYVDHINHDGLDNRRENLRLCTRRQNQQNLRKRVNCSSRYKGVSWHKRLRKWECYIKVNGKQLRLGWFASEQDAARAYDAAAREHFGEFACTNDGGAQR